MRLPIAALALVAATVVAAEERYVPLGGVTEVRFTSEEKTTVVVEVAGTSEAKRIQIPAGESVHVFTSDEPGALRITAGAGVSVRAINRCDACGSTALLPVAEADQSIREATVIAPARDGWRSGVVIVNPDDAPALLTVNGEAIEIAPRGVRHIEASGELSFTGSHRVLIFTWDRNERSGARLFGRVNADGSSPRRRRSARFPEPAAPTPQPQTVTLTPSKDNTLYQDTSGARSNGIGANIFAGTTAGREPRRALLAFDLGSQIPPNSRITRVTLTMTVTLTIAGPERVQLRRVTRDWGEGRSNAGSSRDGGGAAASDGDATWIHAIRPNQRWATPGGDFEAAADATTDVDTGAVTWPSSDAMIARVQAWLDQPSTNFGWIMIGNESVARTAKRFASRESASAELRPTLTVEFTRR